MRALIFGGATEGRTLSQELAGLGAAVTVCVATAYGKEEQGELSGVQVRTACTDGACHRSTRGFLENIL